MTPERWPEIENLYHAAREHGRDVLARADPEIQREVEALLAEDASGKLLDISVDGLLPDSKSAMIATGASVGQYRIESRRQVTPRGAPSPRQGWLRRSVNRTSAAIFVKRKPD